MKTLRSQQKTRRIRSKLRRKRIIIATLLLFIIVDFIYLMNRDYFFIHTVEYQGNEVLDDNDLQLVIDDYLSEKKFFVFPKENTLFLSTKEIEDRLIFAFPRINDIHVDILQDDVLAIEIEERKAHSLWCDHKEVGAEDGLDESCYYVDQTAYVYDRSPYFSNKVFPKIYLSDDRLGPQYQLQSQRDFDAFFDFLGQIEQRFKVDIDHVVIDDFGDVYISLWRYERQVYTSLFPKMIYNQSDSYDDVLQHIELTLNHPDFKKDIKGKLAQLVHIDVRFPGRIFYKITQ